MEFNLICPSKCSGSVNFGKIYTKYHPSIHKNEQLLWTDQIKPLRKENRKTYCKDTKNFHEKRTSCLQFIWAFSTWRQLPISLKSQFQSINVTINRTVVQYCHIYSNASTVKSSCYSYPLRNNPNLISNHV